jgi:hypothetical protein
LPPCCGRRAREVEDEPVAVDRGAQAQLEVALAGLEDVGRRPLAVAQGARRRRASGARRSRGRRRWPADAAAEAGVELAQAPAAGAVRGELARRSARRCAGWRICATSSSIASSSRRRGAITTPSSASVVESAGIEPGVGPPTSAWCARLRRSPGARRRRRRRG